MERAVSLIDLQAAVTQLPTEELTAFARWFEEYLADAWDRRIEADILAGRLDAAGSRADADFEAGRWNAQEVISEGHEPSSDPADIKNWYDKLDALSAQIPAEDHERMAAALAEQDRLTR
jgi:hypothetical protein